MDRVKQIANEILETKEWPKFSSGDTITVTYKIKEGNKERLQSFIRGLIGLQIRMDPGILEWPQRIDILEWPQRSGHHSSALNHSGIAVSTRPPLGDMGVRSHAKDGHKVTTSA